MIVGFELVVYLLHHDRLELVDPHIGAVVKFPALEQAVQVVDQGLMLHAVEAVGFGLEVEKYVSFLQAQLVKLLVP